MYHFVLLLPISECSFPHSPAIGLLSNFCIRDNFNKWGMVSQWSFVLHFLYYTWSWEDFLMLKTIFTFLWTLFLAFAHYSIGCSFLSLWFLRSLHIVRRSVLCSLSCTYLPSPRCSYMILYQINLARNDLCSDSSG